MHWRLNIDYMIMVQTILMTLTTLYLGTRNIRISAERPDPSRWIAQTAAAITNTVIITKSLTRMSSGFYSSSYSYSWYFSGYILPVFTWLLVTILQRSLLFPLVSRMLAYSCHHGLDIGFQASVSLFRRCYSISRQSCFTSHVTT